MDVSVSRLAVGFRVAVWWLVFCVREEADVLRHTLRVQHCNHTIHLSEESRCSGDLFPQERSRRDRSPFGSMSMLWYEANQGEHITSDLSEPSESYCDGGCVGVCVCLRRPSSETASTRNPLESTHVFKSRWGSLAHNNKQLLTAHPCEAS